MYLKALNSFCVKEISNAHLCATLYHGLLDMEGKSTEEAKAAEWARTVLIFKFHIQLILPLKAILRSGLKLTYDIILSI